MFMSALLVAGCGANRAGATGLDFDGSWSGTLTHPAATCNDGSVKAAFSGPTQWQINQDQAGLILMWSARCPGTARIFFDVDATGTARQAGDPVTCINSPTAQATLSSGVMTVAGGIMSATIDETEHDSDTQTRDCEYLLSMTMMRP